jgi:hypothetical protein
MMLTEVCQYLRNWFTRAQYFGEFKIENGELQAQFDNGVEFSALPLLEGQYYRIIGSVLNDGVHQYPNDELKDETFSGAVWSMAVPPAVEGIANEIKEWQAKYGGADSSMLSPFTSESFGGYSYSKGASASGSGSGGVTWASVFGNRLAPWRKI